MKPLILDGIVPIIPTPFFADDRPDWESMRALVDFAYLGGCSAVCLPAYASEFYKLSEDERREAVARAVKYSAGRIPVIAQVNFAATSLAIDAARAAKENGASAISSAVPRTMPLAERDIFRHFVKILESTDLPLLIQDFNPGGPTLSASFVAELNSAFPHFRYIKLEEALMSARVRSITDATSGKVGVLAGWGGMYMVELIPVGLTGVMPAVGISDVLALAFRQARANNMDTAFNTFSHVCPQIVFSLQSIEFFHHAEKRLLEARGILNTAHVRNATVELHENDSKYIDFLNRRLLISLDQLGLARNPITTASAPAR